MYGILCMYVCMYVWYVCMQLTIFELPAAVVEAANFKVDIPVRVSTPTYQYVCVHHFVYVCMYVCKVTDPCMYVCMCVGEQRDGICGDERRATEVGEVFSSCFQNRRLRSQIQEEGITFYVCMYVCMYECMYECIFQSMLICIPYVCIDVLPGGTTSHCGSMWRALLPLSAPGQEEGARENRRRSILHTCIHTYIHTFIHTLSFIHVLTHQIKTYVSSHIFIV